LYRFIILLLTLCSQQLFADSPKRVITLAPHIIENLYAINAERDVVGTIKFSNYPEAAKSIPVVGDAFGLNIEKIISLKPDLVIAWRGGNKTKDIDKLINLGIKVIYSEPKTLEDLFNELAHYGELFDRQSNAQNVIASIKKDLSKLKALYNSKRAVPLFYQLWHKPLQTTGNDPWLNQLIDICGGINIFKSSNSGFPQVSIEQILAAQPEAIIVPTNQSNIVKYLTFWQQWPAINAVKKSNILRVDADALHRYTPRVINGVRNLCLAIDKARN
jgi:vitamin B12 transport system substrate-binding protein